MEIVKPRFLPRSVPDALLSIAVSIIQLFVLFLLPSLIVAAFVSLWAGAICFVGICALFLLFTVKDVRLSREHIQFVRILGFPKRLTWEQISSIEPAASAEVIFKGWLWPLFPAREMTPSLTSRGHYRISYKDGYAYYPPKDIKRFEELISDHFRTRSNKTIEPTR